MEVRCSSKEKSVAERAQDRNEGSRNGWKQMTGSGLKEGSSDDKRWASACE